VLRYIRHLPYSTITYQINSQAGAITGRQSIVINMQVQITHRSWLSWIHGLLTLCVSMWRYTLPSVLTLRAADRRCMTSKNRNRTEIELLAKKSNQNW